LPHSKIFYIYAGFLSTQVHLIRGLNPKIEPFSIKTMLKNLKSLFFVDDEKSQSAPPVSEPAQPTSDPSSVPPAAGGSAVTGSATLDQRMFEALQKTIQDHNMDGFDFLEFRDSLRTLHNIIPDEATRYKSAYATASTMGVTVEKLLETGRFYQGLLEKERDNFNKAVEQQVDQNVTAKQREVDQLKAMIGQKSEEIARLTREIASHQEDLAKAQGVISEAGAKIQHTSNNFQLTLDTVLNQIQTDMNNIEKYLKPNNLTH
jgi:hypothetical protein